MRLPNRLVSPEKINRAGKKLKLFNVFLLYFPGINRYSQFIRATQTAARKQTMANQASWSARWSVIVSRTKSFLKRSMRSPDFIKKFRTTSSAASRCTIAARMMENFFSTPSAGTKPMTTAYQAKL